MFQNIIVLEYLFAARTEHFQHLEQLFDFEVNLFRLLLGLAQGFRAHPNHRGVDARFTEQGVAGGTLHGEWRVIVIHWGDEGVAETTHEELEGGVHLG